MNARPLALLVVAAMLVSATPMAPAASPGVPALPPPAFALDPALTIATAAAGPSPAGADVAPRFVKPLASGAPLALTFTVASQILGFESIAVRAPGGFRIDPTPGVVLHAGGSLYGPSVSTDAAGNDSAFYIGTSASEAALRVFTLNLTTSAPLAEGSYEFVVEIQRLFGAPVPYTTTLVVDGAPPLVSLPDAFTAQAGMPFTFAPFAATDIHLRNASLAWSLNGGAETEINMTGLTSRAFPLNPALDWHDTLAVRIYAQDHAGNVNTATATVTFFDTVPPVPGPLALDTAWKKAAHSIVLTGSDVGSNAMEIDYAVSLDGGQPVVATGRPVPQTLTFTETGVYDVTWLVRDSAGNTAAGDARTYRLDLEAPTVPGLANPSGGWRSVPLTLTFDPTAVSGIDVANTAWSIDGVLQTDPLPDSATIATTGTHTVEWHATSHSGLASSSNFLIRIDVTAPTVSHVVEPVSPNALGWYTSFPSVTVTASDAHVGLSSLVGDVVLGSTHREVPLVPGAPYVFEDEAASVVFNYTAKDLLGNEVNGSVGPLKIDVEPPATPVLSLPTDLTRQSSITATWTPFSAGPSGFGSWKLQERIGTTWTTLQTPAETATSASIGSLTDGERTYRIVAENGAGLTATSNEVELEIDQSGPQVTITLPTITSDETPRLEVSTTEALAGNAAFALTHNGVTTNLPAAPLPFDADIALASGDGSYRLDVTGQDAAGNPASATHTLVLDTTAPVVARTSPASFPRGHPASLAFSVSDLTAVTLALTITRDDGTVTHPTITQANPTTSVALLPASEWFTYSLTATDAAGNSVSLADNITIVFVPTPTIDVEIVGLGGTSPWFVGDATATFTPSEPDAQVFARIGTAPFALVGANLLVSGDGVHVVQYYAHLERNGATVDTPVESVGVRIDTTAPTASFVGLPQTLARGDRLVLDVSAADPTSGVVFANASFVTPTGVTGTQALQLDTNTGRFAGFIGPVPAGSATVRVVVVNGAGIDTTIEATIPVPDTTPPRVTLRDPGSPVSGTVTLVADVVEDSAYTVVYAVNGVALPGADWDTTLGANADFTVSATATDAGGLTGSHTLTVRVANMPVIGAPRIAAEEETLTPTIYTTVTGAAPTAVTLFWRVAGAASFEQTSMSLAGAEHSAGLFPVPAPGSTIEFYIVATRGLSSVVAPPSGVFTLQAPPGDQPWRWPGGTTDDGVGDDTDGHAYIDIVDSGVLVGGGRARFGISLAGPFDYAQPANYLVRFNDGATTYRVYNITYERNDPTSWKVFLENGDGSGRALLANDAERSIWVNPTYNSLILNVSLAALAQDLDPMPSGVTVGFAAYGSFDGTGFSLLDLVAPLVSHAAPAGLVANTNLVLTASTEPGASLTAYVRVAGVDLAPVSFVGGSATIPVQNVDSLTYTIVAVDAAGNRGTFPASGVQTLRDITPPVAAFTIPAASVNEGQPFLVDGSPSTDAVGVTTWLWDVGADGTVDATGRFASLVFLSSGATTVRLIARDASGNSGTSDRVVNVIETLPPFPVISFPANGGRVAAGNVRVVVDAPGAASAAIRVGSGAWMPATLSANKWVVDWSAGEGTHSLVARATDASGTGMTPGTTTVIVDGTPPSATITPGTGYLGSPISMSVAASDASGIARIQWSFGDGTSFDCNAACVAAGNGFAVSHVYTTAGDHALRVTVHDGVGLTTVRTATIVVHHPGGPVAPPSAPTFVHGIVAPSKGLVGEEIVFQSRRAAQGEFTGISWYWDYGNANRDIRRDGSQTYSAPGDYVVTLTTMDNAGNLHVAKHTIRIDHPAPPATPPPPPPPPRVEPPRIRGLVVEDKDGDGVMDTLVAPDATWTIQRIDGPLWFAMRGDTRFVADLERLTASDVVRVIADDEGIVLAPIAGWVLGEAEGGANALDFLIEDARLVIERGEKVRFLAFAEFAGQAFQAAPPKLVLPLPVTKITPPTGVVRSPAVLDFDAGEGATVYWRVAGAGGWRTNLPAEVGGDGAVVVEFYALGPGGREVTRSLTLELDGLAPVLTDLTIEPADVEPGVPVRVSARAVDAHLDRVEVVVRDVDTNATQKFTATRSGDRFSATFTPEKGTFEVTVQATDALGRVTTLAASVPVVVGKSLEPSGDVAGASKKTPGFGLAFAGLALIAVALATRRLRR